MWYRIALWDCSGDAISFFIGCYEAVKETGSIFVPPNSPMLQFDITITAKWLIQKKIRKEKEERRAGSKGEGEEMTEKEVLRE